MQNLAAIVSVAAINQALEEAYSKKLDLRAATKFHIVYKNQGFPPKEIVRLAAKKMGVKNWASYRLAGGESTNRHLKNKGFVVEQFALWQNTNTTKQPIVIEEKIARLVYNTNGWQYPTGIEGKSKTKSYENTYGYGHEEWLFDFTKIIDGYKYGFLEPINKYFDKYSGQVFNIYLYTMNCKTKQKFWVGKLNNVEVIDKQESDRIVGIYKKKGWIAEMKKDLTGLGLRTDGLGLGRVPAYLMSALK